MRDKFEIDLKKVAEWKLKMVLLHNFVPEYIFEDRLTIIEKFLDNFVKLKAYYILNNKIIELYRNENRFCKETI